jgi:hypothetical protein
MDDFEDGTTQNWTEGSQSPNPPTNVEDGGPGGAGDSYLEMVSSGGSGAGSRMVSFNRSQWASDDDYLSAGITGLSIDLNNFSDLSLTVRVAYSDETGPSGTWYASSQGISLSAGSGWTPASFSLLEGDLTRVNGTGSYDDVFTSVSEVRILHSDSPDFQGDAVAATLGVDNITAVPEPSTHALILGCAALAFVVWSRTRCSKKTAAH